ncbi:MAG TPA: hfsB [Caulobacteraceae bacterium]|jgi:Mrp family chromosome partitioning ATPase
MISFARGRFSKVMPLAGAPFAGAAIPLARNGPVDLSTEMEELWRSLGPANPGRGRVVQFIGAMGGEGVSTIAREFAFCAAQRAKKPVWLVDLDLFKAGQQAAVAKEARRYGELGAAAAASPDGSVFFAVEPAAANAEGLQRPQSRYLSARPAASGRMWVTRFHAEALVPGQSVTVSRWPAYWNALRKHAEYIVIDAPAADRSTAALTLAPLADVNIMVVAAEAGDAREPAALKAAVEEAGGSIAGLVFNRAEARPPAFLQSLV